MYSFESHHKLYVIYLITILNGLIWSLNGAILYIYID